MSAPNRKLPPWLRRPLPAGQRFQRTDDIIDELSLNTICVHAHCPNRGECWARGTATVLILGSVCTRRCHFCSVASGRPEPPDPTEPARLADLVERMGLRTLVMTSVNRDDLPDGGAGHFRACIEAVRHRQPQTRFEILVPDFRGHVAEALATLRAARPFVFAHNVEMVPELYPKARPGGNYRESLDLLARAKSVFGDETPTKSSIMLGLGETDEQVERTLADLRAVGCDRLTIGQYLRPSKDSLEVVEYIHPDRFAHWRRVATDLGFRWVISAPFARSSYFAERTDTSDLFGPDEPPSA